MRRNLKNLRWALTLSTSHHSKLKPYAQQWSRSVGRRLCGGLAFGEQGTFTLLLRLPVDWPAPLAAGLAGLAGLAKVSEYTAAISFQGSGLDDFAPSNKERRCERPLCLL